MEVRAGRAEHPAMNGTSRARLAWSLAVALVAALVLPALARPAHAASWPMFRGDLQRLASETATSMTAPLELRWTAMTGGQIAGSPVVVAGVVYVGSVDGNVYAINLSTGKTVWSRDAGAPVLGSPAVVGGVVYVGTSQTVGLLGLGSGHIYALRAGTGSVKWSRAIGANVWSSPAVANGVVYIGSNDSRLRALSAETGATLWSYLAGDNVISSPAVSGGRVYVGSADHKVRALDASTGALVWTAETSDNVRSTPAVSGGRVYVGSADFDLYALDAATGGVGWRLHTHHPVLSSPAVDGDTVYFGSNDSRIYAADASTGTRKWSYLTGGAVHSSPAVANGTVYFGSDDGVFRAVGAADGNLIWSYDAGAGNDVVSSPAIAGNIVIVGSNDGTLYAFIDRTPALSALVVAPGAISPNGDGVKDTARAGFRLEQASRVDVEVVDGAGTVVAAPVAGTTLPAGSNSVLWDGKDAGGAPATEGTYRVVVRVLQAGGARGQASVPVRVDLTAPTAGSLRARPNPFYPGRPGSIGRASIRFTLSEACSVTLKIYNSAGRFVRTIRASKPAGIATIVWTGKDSRGRYVPSGRYRLKLYATDAAWNRATAYPVGGSVRARRP